MKKYLSLVLVFNVMLLNFAQQKDSLKIENKRFDFQYKKIYVPAALMVSGIIADGNGRESLKNEIVEDRNEHLLGFENHFDDYAQFAPFFAICACAVAAAVAPFA